MVLIDGSKTMLEFFENYAATIIICIVIIIAVIFAIRKIVKNKKSGIGPCGQKCCECNINCNKRNK